MNYNSLLVSVVLPTHNPHPLRFERVLQALKRQTLPYENWELLVIDNASAVVVEFPPNYLSNQLSARIVLEPRLGLTSARWAGIVQSMAPLIVFVDDDNVIHENYLAEVCNIFSAYPGLGAAGGKAIPEYEVAPPSWFHSGMAPLGCRDLGDGIMILNGSNFLLHPTFPSFAPIGAGMALRKQAVLSWLETALDSSITDRRGNSLSSAGDCDIILFILDGGWDVGYFPSLILVHLIGAARVSQSYLEAVSRSAFRDFIRVLDHHGIRTWSAIRSWTIPFRTLRAWFTFRAWRGPAQRLRWQGAIGQFEGRAALDSYK